MKILLRSVFNSSANDNNDLLYQNASALSESGLEFDLPEERSIWQHIQEFIQLHRHVPDRASILLHFQQLKEPEICDLAESIATYPPVFRGNFIQRLESKQAEKRTAKCKDILSFAGDILQTGKVITDGRKKIKLQGPIDAIRYISEKSHEIVAPSMGNRLSGEVTKDGESFKKEYELVESDPLAGIGQFCGIQQIDESMRGAKRNELWIHAAFTGGLKSVYLLNWAYTQSVFYGHSSLMFSLEMPYTQCRRMLNSMHSFHDKFSQVRVKLGLQPDLAHPAGVPYEKIRDGEMTAPQKKFMFEYVEPDFAGKPTPKDLKPYKDSNGNLLTPPGGYGEINIEQTDPDKDDFTITDLRTKAEVTYARAPYRTIFIDHLGLMSPRTRSLNGTTERLNEVLRDAKKLAMSFNRGQGIAVVGAFQISRKGYEAALKTGMYLLSHLSYANECERSADVVTTTFVNDEMQKANRVKYQCLKSRDNAPFQPFTSRVEYAYRRILTDFDGVEMYEGNAQGKKKFGTREDADLDQLLDPNKN